MFTYFFHNPESGLTKIGRSKHPVSRFGTIAKDHPSLVPVCVFGADIEKQLHADFSEFRVTGEWFQLDESQIETAGGLDGNLLTFDSDGNPIIPGSVYTSRAIQGNLVQIEVTEEELRIIDDAAKIERRSRKAQVTEAALRDSRRVIESATATSETESAKP